MSKKMRNGYTTGSCAAAGMKAVLLYLLKGSIVSNVEISALTGEKLTIPIKQVAASSAGTYAEVIKDAGDDPDITQGISIFTQVKINSSGIINFFAGDGIGKVTKNGLSVPVGQPSINPGPRKMMTNIALLV